MNTNLIAIENAAISFVDNSSGHIGMAPRNTHEGGNFIEQLIDQELIDHHIFSIYINESKQKSVIKFGNWDKKAAHS